ncbi:Anthranilate synthase component 1 [archaeon HR06]|nr:Anthranilate synthase component 1 [archaeon HR06]
MDMNFALFLDGFIFDHIEGNCYYYSFTEDRSSLTEEALIKDFEYSEPKVNIDKEDFEDMVRVAKNYIIEGDIFQVVLSKRFEFEIKGEPIKFYENLRKINPSPYMYYIKFGDERVIGSSPEMLIRVEGKMVETYPIAGTRALTEDEEENKRLAKELINDEKEKAEHVMLVDLARNDLGRICKFGTVKVPEFMIIHTYSHVQHMVSRVTGELREDIDSFKALKYVFPAGTVSGAPKIRAMEIIDELEPCRRGVYAGAVGYFSLNRNSDFAIAIRTLAVKEKKARIQVGAGIVYDSKPEKEWLETEQKAKALMKALELSKS